MGDFHLGIWILLVFSLMIVPGDSCPKQIPGQIPVAWAAMAEVSNSMMVGTRDSSPFQSDCMINYSFASRYSVCSKFNDPPTIFEKGFT